MAIENVPVEGPGPFAFSPDTIESQHEIFGANILVGIHRPQLIRSTSLVDFPAVHRVKVTRVGSTSKSTPLRPAGRSNVTVSVFLVVSLR